MDMTAFQIINIFANAIICIGITGFFVLLFGNTHSIIQKWNVLQHWTLKVTLVSIIACSAWNALHTVYIDIIPRGEDIVTVVDAPVGEVLLNVGLAFLFAWIVYFHKYHFLEAAPLKPTRAKPKTKKRIVKK
jgi:predicted permease